jgi:hypothetical protein
LPFPARLSGSQFTKNAKPLQFPIAALYKV